MHLNCPLYTINKSSKVSPSKSWVHLFLRLFLIFFRVNHIRSFVCNMKRPSVKQSMKQQVSSNFQIYPGKSDDRPPCLKVSDDHNSFTLYTALHVIQLYVLSFGVELLDRSVIYLFLQKISVNLQLLCF